MGRKYVDIDGTVEELVAQMREAPGLIPDETVRQIGEANGYTYDQSREFLQLQSDLAPVIGEITRWKMLSINKDADPYLMMMACGLVLGGAFYNIARHMSQQPEGETTSEDDVHQALHVILDAASKSSHDLLTHNFHPEDEDPNVRVGLVAVPLRKEDG
jgi:hypothetical protein